MKKVYRNDLQIFADILSNHTEDIPNRLAKKICKGCNYANIDCDGLCSNTIYKYIKRLNENKEV